MRLDSSCYRSSATALGCWNRVRDFAGALGFHKPLAVDSREAQVLRACSAHVPFPLGAACPSAAPPAERPTDGALRLCFAAPENARQGDDGSCSSPDETLRQATAAPGSQDERVNPPFHALVGPALRAGRPVPPCARPQRRLGESVPRGAGHTCTRALARGCALLHRDRTKPKRPSAKDEVPAGTASDAGSGTSARRATLASTVCAREHSATVC